MLDQDQSKEVAEAILEPERQRLAKKKERRLRWVGHDVVSQRKKVFGIIGFGLGSITGLFSHGEWMPLAIAGMGLGFLLASVLGWIRMRFNK